MRNSLATKRLHDTNGHSDRFSAVSGWMTIRVLNKLLEVQRKGVLRGGKGKVTCQLRRQKLMQEGKQQTRLIARTVRIERTHGTSCTAECCAVYLKPLVTGTETGCVSE